MNHVEVVQGFEPPKRKSLKVWRYLDLDKFTSLLEKRALYFASARQFDDAFEGSITRRHHEFQLKYSSNGFGVKSDFYQKHISNAFYELTRLTKISCWHINEHESAAMWQLYLSEGKGIAIQSTIGRLQSSLKPFKLKAEYGEETLRIGKVKYIDYRKDVMADKSMLDRFFYKRKSFSHERELRVAVSLRMAEEYGVSVPEKGVFVGAKLENLISAVHLAPLVDSEFRSKIEHIVSTNDFKFPIKQSEMDDEALF